MILPGLLPSVSAIRQSIETFRNQANIRPEQTARPPCGGGFFDWIDGVDWIDCVVPEQD